MPNFSPYNIASSLLIFHSLAGVIFFKSGPKALIAKSNRT